MFCKYPQPWIGARHWPPAMFADVVDFEDHDASSHCAAMESNWGFLEIQKSGGPDFA